MQLKNTIWFLTFFCFFSSQIIASSEFKKITNVTELLSYFSTFFKKRSGIACDKYYPRCDQAKQNMFYFECIIPKSTKKLSHYQFVSNRQKQWQQIPQDIKLKILQCTNNEFIESFFKIES